MDINRLYEELGRSEIERISLARQWSHAKREATRARELITEELDAVRDEVRVKSQASEDRIGVFKKAIFLALDGMDPLLAKLTAEKEVHDVEEEEADEEDDDEEDDDIEGWFGEESDYIII